MARYDSLYRRYGAFKLTQLANPPINFTTEFELPLNALYHFVPQVIHDRGPSMDDFMVKRYKHPVRVDHVSQLTVVEGTPRHLSTDIRNLARDYHRAHPHFRPARNVEATLNDGQTLLVENYGLLPSIYRYTASMYSDYYRRMNLNETVMAQVVAFNKRSDRHQFIRIKLPEALPTYALLRSVVDARQNNNARRFRELMLEHFNTFELYFIAFLWAEMVAPTHPLEAYDNFNVVFYDYGKFTWLNVGQLIRWAQNDKGVSQQALGDDEHIDWVASSDAEASLQGIDRKIVDVQMRFLRHLIALMEVRTKNDVQDDPTEHPEPEEVGYSEEETVVLDPEDIDRDIAHLEKVAEANVTNDTIDRPEPTILDGVKVVADEMADAGLVSGAEYRRMLKNADRFKEVPNPYGGPGTLADLAVVTHEEMQITAPKVIKSIEGVTDTSMLKQTFNAADKTYTKNILPKHITQAVMQVQKEGYSVVGYTVEPVISAVNDYSIHRVTIMPPKGSPFQMTFRLPTINAGGTMLIDGTEYRFRPQRIDMPIRKVSASRVALTSYYGKVFVDRAEKKAYNLTNWLQRIIQDAISDNENTTLTNGVFGNAFYKNIHVPLHYSIISQQVRSFDLNGIAFYFDYERRVDHFGASVVKQAETKNFILVGLRNQKPVVMGNDNVVYEVTPRGPEPLGTIPALMGYSADQVPMMMATVMVYGKPVPLGLVLGYYIGLPQLLTLTGAEYRLMNARTRDQIAPDEFVIRFSDEWLVINRDSPLVELIFSGFLEASKILPRYSYAQFRQPEIYIGVLEQMKISVTYAREIRDLRTRFIDNITVGLLEQMGEPTAWVPLLLRSAKLLTTEWHPDEMSMAYQRFRGSERLAGTVYNEISRAIKQETAKPASARGKLTINPEAVWMSIVTDAAMDIAKTSNPIAQIRQNETVTHTGKGGRGGKSMVYRTRKFSDEDLGVTSEGTVDSGSVGIVSQVSPAANITSLYGTTRPYNPETDGPASVVSSAALLAPSVEHDAIQRIIFVGIQQSAGVSGIGYQPSPVNTGYDKVIAHDTDYRFSGIAEQDGVVTNITDRVLSVRYKDGTEAHFELGRIYGKAAGLGIPHTLVANAKIGQSFTADDVLVYNKEYFQPDYNEPSQVIWKAGVLVRTALVERDSTHEDASEISPRVAQLLSTPITKVREITLRYDQAISELVKPGASVNAEDILCIIEDAGLSESGVISDESRMTLRRLGRDAPSADIRGTVERIEVLYNGDLEEMSQSLRAVTRRSDLEMQRHHTAMGRPGKMSGAVTASYRVEGNPLQDGNAVIRIYISTLIPMDIGYKGVYANQMKSIFSGIMSGPNTMADGTDIDAFFSYQSINNRNVDSAIRIGMANFNLETLAHNAIALYKGTTQ